MSLAALTVMAATISAGATVLTDPVGDFNTPFYTGRQRADLDVVSVSATFDGSVFHLGATMAGPIDTSANAGLLYVFGVNKGGATAPGPFAAIGDPNVLFNAVFTLTGTGVLTERLRTWTCIRCSAPGMSKASRPCSNGASVSMISVALIGLAYVQPSPCVRRPRGSR